MAFFATSMENSAAPRSGVYRLLARLWLREVDVELAENLRKPPLSKAFVEAGGALPPSDEAQALETLAIDYCQLFVGPKGHLPPYQSVWSSGQFGGDAIASMQQFAALLGYELDSIPDGVMLDHLAIQLDAMGNLLEQISVWPKDQADDLDEVKELAVAFFQNHLTWPSALLDAAEDRATTDFYRALIRVTRDFLASEAD